MQPTKATVQSLFERERQYLIPLFQRHYVWDKPGQWIPLWDDIESKAKERETVLERGRLSHFTGAIVIQQKSTNTSEVAAYEIIDGQQRLTTFQIILCAFRSVCREHKGDEFLRMAKKAERFLVNPDVKGSDKYKLMPTQFDRAAMGFLVDHTDPLNQNAPEGVSAIIIDAYKYFHAEIKAFINGDGDKAHALLTAIGEDFGFVEILVEGEDEPGMIFESLNARGKPLLQFDLLRNYLFLRARQDRDELYNTYWRDFETTKWDNKMKVGRSKIALSELFFQHFLMAKLATETVVPLFQTYRNAHENVQARDALKTLHQYSQEYLPLAINGHDSPTGRMAQAYHHLDITSLRPFFLYLLAEAGVAEKHREHLFHALESYTVRRVLCTSQGHKDYNKFFPELIGHLRHEGFSPRKLLTLLAGRDAASRKWPQDHEVQNAFGGHWHEIYINRNVVRYILYRIECHLREENPRTENVALDFNGLTLEHIMPQSWDNTWKLPAPDGGVFFYYIFNEEYQNSNVYYHLSTHPEILMRPESLASDSYIEALNRAQGRLDTVQSIGNLTLLTQKLNSSVSNAPFIEKKQGMGENSLLFLNRDVCAKADWDVAQIKEREARLCDIFCNKLWPNAQWFLDNIPSE